MSELETRRKKITGLMQAAGADACLVTTNVNLLYATGQIVMGALYLTADRHLLLVRRPVGLTGDSVAYIRKPEDIPDILRAHDLPLPETLMLENDSMSHSEWLRYEAVFAGSRIINGTPALRGARSVKTKHEIELIRQSGRQHAAAYRRIPEVYRPGMTDVELSIEIERLMRQEGSLGIFRVFGNSMEIFVGSLLTGDNAAAPSPYDFGLGGAGQHPSLPVGANHTPMHDGMAVMVDMGGCFAGYLTDMTRTFAIGRLPDEAYTAHQVALDIQQAVVDMARPGATGEEIYNRALFIARSCGLEHCFMGCSQQARFVGHGVGLEINELPVLGARAKEPLEAGMMIAVEPKFVIPHVGAVGIENTFVVTPSGGEKLTVMDDAIIPLA